MRKIDRFKRKVVEVVNKLGNRPRSEETLVVSGSPRSGTTWLAEMIRVIPGYKMLNEPLNLHSSVPAQNIDCLDWRTNLNVDAQVPEIEKMLRQVLEGRIGALHMWRFQSEVSVGRLAEQIVNRKVVVKMVRVNRMLSWLSSRFPVRAIISIFRHPCAVVASQMGYQANWRDATPPDKENIKTGFFGTLPDPVLDRFGDTLSEISTTAGYLAAIWSLDTYLALRGPMRGPWIVTTYENLVQDTEGEMQSILDSIGEPMPADMRQRFGQPSNSAAEDLRTEDVDVQLTKWKRNLSKAQIDAVLRVVRAFPINFYTESPLPDQKELRKAVEGARRDDPVLHTNAGTP